MRLKTRNAWLLTPVMGCVMLTAQETKEISLPGWPGFRLLCDETLTPNGDEGGPENGRWQNYRLIDPEGTVHSFPGSSSVKYIPVYGRDGSIKYNEIRKSLKTMSSDGCFSIDAMDLYAMVKGIGKIFPKYRVVTIGYAPPGRDSFVDYTNSKTLGSVCTDKTSWSNGISISASAGVFGIGGSFSFSVSKFGTSEYRLSASKSESSSININGSNYLGSPTDGLDHGNDLFYVCLNQAIDVTQNSTTSSLLEYTPDARCDYAQSGTYFVTIMTMKDIQTWINDPNWVPSGPFARTWAGEGQGLTKADLQNIIQMNPYWNDVQGTQTSVNGLQASGRFTAIPVNISYVPSSNPSIYTYSAKYSTSSGDTASTGIRLSSEAGITGGYKIGNLLNLSINGKSYHTFEYVNTITTNTDDKITKTLSIKMPGLGYTGPQGFVVFQDNLFGSFVFAPCPYN